MQDFILHMMERARNTVGSISLMKKKEEFSIIALNPGRLTVPVPVSVKNRIMI